MQIKLNKPALKAAFNFLVMAALSGCVHYQPKPIALRDSAGAWQDRSFANEGLRAFIDGNLGACHEQWPPNRWDMRLLTVAAFYYHPELDIARAKLGIAQAGIVTASGRPNPSVGAGVSYATPAGVDPWILQPALDIPIETMGKRGYRVQQAKQLSEAARLELAATAWAIRSRLRSALLNLLLAEREVELLIVEERVRSDLLSILETRVRIGDLPRQLATIAQIDAHRVRQQRLESEGRFKQARANLAESIGMPISALEDGLQFVFSEFDSPPADSSLTNRIQRDVLLNRLDIRRGLAEYAATESALQMEIARQYPDVQISPGYRWRESEQRWQLGVSMTIPVLNQNQGPIAEAVARRELAAAQFQSIEATAQAELDRALSNYRSAQRSLAAAVETLSAAEATERDVQQAFAAGDVDAGAVAESRLVTALARREHLAAVRNAQAALGALEDAVQKPLDNKDPMPTVPEIGPRIAQPCPK